MKANTILKRVLPFIFALTLISCSAKGAANDMAMETTAANGKYSYSTSAPGMMADADFGYLMEKAEAEVSPSYDASYSDIELGGSITEGRKIIRNVSMSLETKEYDGATATLENLVAKFGGYVESSQTYGKSLYSGSASSRSARYTVRLPAASLDAFISDIESGETLFNITDKSENAQDITETYYDSEARLNSLLTQEERLLKMLEGATELQYMLEIENTLANVRYQIESYYSLLKSYDNQVAMSTVNININEVIEYKEPVTVPITFGERMANALKRSWENLIDDIQDFAVDFTYNLPLYIFWAIVIVVVIILVRRKIKKARAKKAALTAAKASEEKKDEVK